MILKQGNDFKAFRIKSLASPDTVAVSDIEKAKLSISEDGDFVVKAVSDRLVNFAKAISGGDKSRLAELKSAIDDGFAAARDALGGYLPAICNKTYNETMRKLDALPMKIRKCRQYSAFYRSNLKIKSFKEAEHEQRSS